jgi:hypothetical protein
VHARWRKSQGETSIDEFIGGVYDDAFAIIGLVYIMHGRQAGRAAVRDLYENAVAGLTSLGANVSVNMAKFAKDRDWKGNN